MADHATHASSHVPDTYFFDGGTFEPLSGRLVHLDAEVRLRPKTAGVLAALLERPGQVISKAELVDRVWGGAAGDEALAVCVAELRRALHEGSTSARLIGTVHRRGYRFLSAVSTVPLQPPARSGHGLVGRGPALDVLETWWRRASAGERTTGFVAGEAGAGKTALLRAFVGVCARVRSSRSARAGAPTVTAPSHTCPSWMCWPRSRTVRTARCSRSCSGNVRRRGCFT